MKVGKHNIVESQRAFIIAEVAMGHDGSLGSAFAHVEAAAAIGVDAVKFQTHLAEHESSKFEQFRTSHFVQDKTRYDYWKRTEFSFEEWRSLAAFCKTKGLEFLSSPFSVEAFEMLNDIGVCAWKVASGETTNKPLLSRMSETGLPIFLSSGMSSWKELDSVVLDLKNTQSPLAVLHCTSAYPCEAENVGLQNIKKIADRYEVVSGFSDHTATIGAPIAARVLGAQIIEIHLSLSKRAFGPDVSSSLTPKKFKRVVEDLRFVEAALFHDVDKDQIAEEMVGMRQKFNKSLFARRHLKKGDVLQEDDVASLKPVIGIESSNLDRTIGLKLLADIEQGDPVKPTHLEGFEDKDVS